MLKINSVEEYEKKIKRVLITEEEIKAFYKLMALYHFSLQATIVELFGLDCIDEAFIDRLEQQEEMGVSFGEAGVDYTHYYFVLVAFHIKPPLVVLLRN